MMEHRWERHLNALMAVLLSAVLWGALAIQFIKHEMPCPLCFLQRLGMLGVASGALMNVKFGPRKAHYGFSLFFAVFGGFVALRQIALHVCPGFPIFGHPFWGLSLYTWSFIVFASSIFYIGSLFLIFDKSTFTILSKGAAEREGAAGSTKDLHMIPYFHRWWQIAFILVFLVALTNCIGVLWQCGLGPCKDI